MEEKVNFLQKILSILGFIIFNTVTFILATLIFFVLPLVPIICLPIVSIKYIVGKVGPRINPKLGKVVSAGSQFFALDDMYKKPKANVSISMTIEGTLSKEKLIETFDKYVLQASYQNGELKYPELKQYFTNWGGYVFFKKCDNFNIANHVTLCDKFGKDVKVTEEDVVELSQYYIQKPWGRRIPLWEFIIVQNYYPKYHKIEGAHTNLMFNVHHSFGDGYSLLTLLIEGLCQYKVKNVVPVYVKRSLARLTFFWVTFIFRYCWEAVSAFLHGTVLASRWITTDGSNSHVHTGLTNWIPVRKLKEIRAHFQVSFSSVVLAICTGALRDMSIKKWQKVPQKLPICSILPLPGHSLKLRTHATMGFSGLPTGEEDPATRVKLCQQALVSMKRSTLPVALHWWILVIGSLPRGISRLSGQNNFVSGNVSSFPAGLEYIDVAGHRFVDAFFSAGLLPGRTGFCFAALSFVDGFRMSPIVNANILSKEETAELTRLVEKHVDILYQYVLQEV